MGGGEKQRIIEDSSSSSSSNQQSANLIHERRIQLTSHVQANENGLLAMASLKAPTLDESKRAPIDIVCVIDKSGSMTGDKLALTKQAICFVIDQLDHRDSLGIVTYDSTVSTDLVLTKMIYENKKTAKFIVENIRPGSMTNLSGGLLVGLDMAIKRQSPNDVCSVLLFTDGLANVGMTTIEKISAATESKFKRMTKACSLFTFGFGSDHDPAMLQQISSTGKGLYYFLEGVDQIPVSFADCLGGLQSVVGQNLKLTIKGHEGTVITKVLNKGYKVLGQLPGEECGIELLDLYAEEERDILFQVNCLSFVPGSSKEQSHNIKISLEYFNVIDAEDCNEEVEILNMYPSDCPQNEKIFLQLERLKVAQAMEKGYLLAEQGKLMEAKMVLEETRERVTTSRNPYTDMLTEELDDCIFDMNEQTSERGMKKMMSKATSHNMQRCVNVSKPSGNMYENQTKVKFKKNFMK